MKLRALKTFCAGGSLPTYQGEEFEANERHAQEYVRLGLAEEVETNLLTKEAELASQLVEPEIFKSDYSEEELKEKNVTDLKKIAKNIGVTGFSGMSKSELIFAILAKQKANMEG